VAVHIAGPVRPSMFFYMPAELARREPDPVTGQVLLVRGEQPPIKEFLEAHRPAYVFTDAKRARALLESTPALSPEMQRGRWVLLRAAPIQRVAER